MSELTEEISQNVYQFQCANCKKCFIDLPYLLMHMEKCQPMPSVPSDTLQSPGQEDMTEHQVQEQEESPGQEQDKADSDDNSEAPGLWPDKYIQVIIGEFRKSDQKLQVKKKKQKQVFEDIQKLLKAMNAERTLTQIQNKYKALLNKYKVEADRRKKSGESGPQDCRFPYFDDFDELLGKNPSVNPPFTFSNRDGKRKRKPETEGSNAKKPAGMPGTEIENQDQTNQNCNIQPHLIQPEASTSNADADPRDVSDEVADIYGCSNQSEVDGEKKNGAPKKGQKKNLAKKGAKAVANRKTAPASSDAGTRDVWDEVADIYGYGNQSEADNDEKKNDQKKGKKNPGKKGTKAVANRKTAAVTFMEYLRQSEEKKEQKRQKRHEERTELMKGFLGVFQDMNNNVVKLHSSGRQAENELLSDTD